MKAAPVIFPAIAAQQIDPRRACLLCAFSSGADKAETARCWHPSITRGRGPVPCDEARADAMLCGPDIREWSSRHDFQAANRTVGQGATRGDDR